MILNTDPKPLIPEGSSGIRGQDKNKGRALGAFYSLALSTALTNTTLFCIHH